MPPADAACRACVTYAMRGRPFYMQGCLSRLLSTSPLNPGCCIHVLYVALRDRVRLCMCVWPEHAPFFFFFALVLVAVTAAAAGTSRGRLEVQSRLAD
jgi:hypothetical protein